MLIMLLSWLLLYYLFLINILLSAFNCQFNVYSVLNWRPYSTLYVENKPLCGMPLSLELPSDNRVPFRHQTYSPISQPASPSPVLAAQDHHINTQCNIRSLSIVTITVHIHILFIMPRGSAQEHDKNIQITQHPNATTKQPLCFGCDCEVQLVAVI